MATYQQWVLYAVLVNITIYFVAIVVRGLGFEMVGSLIFLMLLPVGIFAMVAIFLLANELHHVVVAVLCAVLMFVPCISLLTLLVVNQSATSYLQQRGVKLASWAQIRT